MAIINRHDLTKFDTLQPLSDNNGINPYTLTKKLLKQGDKGESVKWLQWELNQHGANLKNSISSNLKGEKYYGISSNKENNNQRRN